MTWFDRLPPVTRGIIWMSVAALLFALVFGLIRHLSTTYHTFELVFFHQLISLLMMAPWLLRAGPRVLKTDQIGLYWIRAVFSFIGIALFYYGLAKMPIADATALYFTTPLFTVMLTAMLLSERVGPRRWAAIAAGFLGALVVVRPGLVDITLPTLAVLGCALVFGASNTSTRALTLKDSPNVVVFYALLMTLALAAGPAAYFWIWPPLSDIPWFLVLGLGGYLGLQTFTRAIAAATPGAVMPAFYLQLPFAAAVAYVWFDQIPVIWVWIGAAIICASTYYVMRRESADNGTES